MGEICASGADGSNNRAVTNGSGSRITVTDDSYDHLWFKKAARQLLPQADAGFILNTITNISESTCYRAVRGDSQPSLYMFHRLVRRPDGYPWLSRFMAGCQEEWWRDIELTHDLAAAYRVRLQK